MGIFVFEFDSSRRELFVFSLMRQDMVGSFETFHSLMRVLPPLPGGLDNGSGFGNLFWIV